MKEIPVSPRRLRVGIILLFLWWIPFWLLQPVFAVIFGIGSTTGQTRLLVGILVIQTILGFAGLFIAGKQVATIVRHTSYKKLFPTVWRAVIHGEIQ